jgi:predicted ATPase/DNA-binding SARP family transcriptional activator
MLQVRLLGQFDVHRDGAPVLIPSRLAQSLLAYLLLTAGTAHRREKLAGLLWPDTTDENARRNLRQELWRLRKAIESSAPGKGVTNFLLVDEITIAFDSQSDYWLDVSALAKPDDAAASSQDLIEALSLYRGELLPGFYDEWAVLERERLRALLEQKMARLLDLLIEEKRWRTVLEWGERWIALGQSPEPAYRALMVAHGALGDRSKVAAVLERCAQALRDDLGVEPSAQTQALFEQLASNHFRTTDDSLPARPPAMPPRVTNLPVPLTSFIGREREIAQIEPLVLTGRLLTLTGSGGAGKTRLAIEVARRLVNEFANGVWWADLAATNNPALVPQAIGLIFDLRESPTSPSITLLTNYLRDQELLLALDNCEHLIDACAQLTHTLLSQCPKLRILVTSRQPLGITGELTWRVPSLALPEVPADAQHVSVDQLSQYDALQLFVERAVAVAPSWAFAENAATVAQICARLDGIPLAIELAAARLRALSAREIAARLDDRFNLLTGGSRTALPRHRALRATMDWSYELLSDTERALLRRLAVFIGGFALEAVEHVCGDSEDQTVALLSAEALNLLTALVDKSLVIVGQKGETTRYRLLETVRQYALEKLAAADEEENTRQRHLQYFLQLAERAYPEILTAREKFWADRLEADHDNIHAALAWGIEHDLDAAARLAFSLHFFWDAYSHLQEGRDWLERILPKIEKWGNDVRRARVLNAAGNITRAQLDNHTARSLFGQSLAISEAIGARWEMAFALWGLGIVHHFFNDSQVARRYLERALALYQELGSENFPARILRYMGSLAHQEGDLPSAQKLFEEAIALAREAGDRMCLAGAVYSLANVSLEREDFQSAAGLYKECWALCQDLPSGLLSINAQRSLAVIAQREGDYQRARPLLKNCITLYRKQGSHTGLVHCLEELARSAILMGQLVQSVRLLGASEALRGAFRVHLPRFRQDWEYKREPMLAGIIAALGPEAFEQAWAEGRKMTLDEAIAYALAEPETEESRPVPSLR